MIRRVPWGATWRIYLQSNRNWVWISFAIGCWTNELLKDRWTIYNGIKIIRRWCTKIGVRFAGALVADQKMIQRLSMLLILFCGMNRKCIPVRNSTSRSSFVVSSWKQNNQLSIVDIIEVKRKKMYCCNDVTNNLRGSIPPNIYLMEGEHDKIQTSSCSFNRYVT